MRRRSMLLHDFSSRAEECLEISKRADSQHDRELFLELARAWYGLKGDETAKTPETKH
jgi:hypothetical protein